MSGRPDAGEFLGFYLRLLEAQGEIHTNLTNLLSQEVRTGLRHRSFKSRIVETHPTSADSLHIGFLNSCFQSSK
jgi:hypothetical protein